MSKTKKTKSISTVNVLESANGEILSLKSFSDNLKGNLLAENHFMKCVQENSGGDRSKFMGIDYYLEEGNYSDGAGYECWLIHSNQMLIASAILSDFDGKIHTGKRHHNVIRDLAAMGFPKPINGEQGFIDENGKFYNRAEAAKYVIENKQELVKHSCPFNPNFLYSEDIFP